ncbi:MAG: alanine racemase, partial [Lachnospiraceae bacterium]|nr:alanine racemase [Lachnospiraceae bacterium]
METINVKKYERTNVSVDLTAVRHNLLQLKSNLPEGVKLMAVVKTDGYGHGAFAIAKYTQDIIDGYAVATAEEALSLRRHNIIDKMILILGVVTEAFYEELIKAEIRIPVFDIETVDKLNDIACRIGKKAVVHVKVDTGMSRIGIRSREEVIDFVEYINDLPGIYMEGIFTHFAKADNKDKSATKVQYDKFTALLSELEVKNINIPIRHCANSAAVLNYKKAWLTH